MHHLKIQHLNFWSSCAKNSLRVKSVSDCLRRLCIPKHIPLDCLHLCLLWSLSENAGLYLYYSVIPSERLIFYLHPYASLTYFNGKLKEALRYLITTQKSED